MRLLWLVLAWAAIPVLGCSAEDSPSVPSQAGGPADDAATDSTLETDGGDGALPPDGDTGDPPVEAMSPEPATASFPNPERGFLHAVSIVEDGGDYEWIRDDGMTLAHSYVRLDDYRASDLDPAVLDAATAGFQRARSAGIKVVLRFAYNFGPYPDSEPDASKSWVLKHIEELTPLLQANADVIAVVQAGFIGAWGEWHTSTEGLLDNPQDKFDILEALLAAVPVSRGVQLRYPPYKKDGYGDALTANEAFTASSKSRIGHHNDCFLASDDDWGTYTTGQEEAWKDYLAQENLYVPMGGETCNPNPPRSECAVAVAEMQRLRFTYINADYHGDVVASWTAGGCREEMERRLGYRLRVEEVTYPPSLRPGGVLPLQLRLANDGFAPPINPRPVQVVIDGPVHAVVQLPSVDLRRWAPGETAVEAVRLRVPRGLPEGEYRVGVALPDAAPGLAADPRYSIRLANDGVWDAASGVNYFVTVSVDDSAPGGIDESASEFAPL